MLRGINPAAILEPAGAYTHAIEVPPGARLLYISGQVGLRPDGSIAADIAGQAEQVWRNIAAILAEAGMGVGDLVKITSLVTKTENFPGYAKVRAQHLGTARPASTSFVVPALVRPEWLVEVEAVAAKT